MKPSKSLYRISVLVFFLVANISFAQMTRSTIGIKGGVNVAHLAVTDLNSEQNMIGYNAGAFVRVGVTRMFAVQPEVLLSNKGTVLDYNNAFVTGKAKVTLRYVEVPVLAVINFTKFVNIHAGPYWSYLTNVSVSNRSETDFKDQINKDNFQKNDYGFVLGAGAELGALTVGARYVEGLSDIGRTKEFFGQPYDFPGARNYCYQIYLGLKFF